MNKPRRYKTKDTTMKDFEIQTKVTIPVGRVADLIASALEGGSNFWISHVVILDEGGDELNADQIQSRLPIGPPDGPNYNRTIMAPICDGSQLAVVDNEGDKHILNRFKIALGLEGLAQKPELNWHWNDILNEDDDCDTADVFLQECLFGEIIYG